MTRRTEMTRNLPAAIRKALLPDEPVIAAHRRHPVFLIGPAAEAIGVLLVALLITTGLREDQLLKIFIWTIATLVLLGFYSIIRRWGHRYLILTDRRILVVSGDRIEGTPLATVADMVFERRFGENRFGYGSLRTRSGDRVFDYIRCPKQFYLQLCATIYGYRSDSNDETTGAMNADEHESDDTYVLEGGESAVADTNAGDQSEDTNPPGDEL